MFRVDGKEIKSFMDFSAKVAEACSTIQDGAGCDNCPANTNNVYCFASCTVDEVFCIHEEDWKTFFDFADDVESGLDFVAACTPDRSDWDEC